MLKIFSNLLVIGMSIISIGCSAENYSRVECPKLAHQYGLVNNGIKMCFKDEDKLVCNNRLYTNFSNRLDSYIAPYLQIMKELDVKHEKVYKLDVELFACGSFCKNLRAEIQRLYSPNIAVNRYQALKNYSQNLKRKYASSVGIQFSQTNQTVTSSHVEPIATNPIKKELTLKNIPKNCHGEYKLYLQEERTKNRNVQMLNTTIYNLNSCIEKKKGR